MKQFKLLFIFLFGFYSINAQENTKGSFDSLTLQAEWEYFNTGQESSLLRKATIEQNYQRYEEALATLQRVRRLPDTVLFQQTLLFYLTGQYERVERMILQQRARGLDLHKDWYVLEIVSKIQTGQWTEAKKVMIQNREILGLTIQQIDQILTEKDQWKSGNKAFNLSVFFPGMGQWYAGHPGKGMISGLLQVSSIGFALYSFYTGHYISGALTGVGLFYTFYLGGARYAEMLTVQRNERLSNEKVIQFMNVMK